jgi:hypothetical protein
VARGKLEVGVWMMAIEDYAWGTIKINGHTYTKDVKIVRGTVVPNWWRKEGHNLFPEDIKDIFEAKPEVLVVGTGHDGLMRISAAVREQLADAGIELIAERTRKAVEEYNRLSGTGDAAFAAHLTC